MENKISLDDLEEFDCVPVTRCENCAFSEESDFISTQNLKLYWCALDRNTDFPQWEEGSFCSYGKPKKEKSDN